MAIPLAHAYDTITGRWIGQVPVTWFDRMPHLSHEGPVEEAVGSDEPTMSWTRAAIAAYAREEYGARLSVTARKAQMLAELDIARTRANAAVEESAAQGAADNGETGAEVAEPDADTVVADQQ